MKAYSIEEAESFFLHNSEGTVICIKNGEEKECETYPEAVKFFKDEEE